MYDPLETITNGTVLTDAQALATGTYLLLSGFIGGTIALMTIWTFIKCRDVLFNPSAIPELGMVLSDLGIAGLHPFSGTNAIMNRFLFGVGGCYLYATAGMLFGTFLLTNVVFIAFDRYIVTCQPSCGNMRNSATYMKIFIVQFLNAVFWAVIPNFEWGRYKITPARVTCILDWTINDASMVSYWSTYTFWVGVVPPIVAILIYRKIIADKAGQEVHWCWKGWRKTMLYGGCSIVPVMCYSAYVLVMVWAFVADPKTIPMQVVLLPPLMAKMGGILNPIFYLFANPRLFNCFKKTFGCKFDRTALEEHEIVGRPATGRSKQGNVEENEAMNPTV